MKDSYRQTFQRGGAASEYESRFTEGRYGHVLSGIEFEFLDRLMDRLPDPARLTYLDFACGTGRILSHMESRVGSAVGIDIAQPMLDVAHGKISRATLLCKDVTTETGPPEGSYDLITSFRFFLNAEPSLRHAVMLSLAKRLRDADSRLVFSVQGILNSHKVVSWLGHRLATVATGRPPGMGTMSMGAVKRLVADAGLEIEEVFGYDVLSGKARHLLGFQRLGRIERRLAGTAFARQVGGHRIFVVKRRTN